MLCLPSGPSLCADRSLVSGITSYKGVHEVPLVKSSASTERLVSHKRTSQARYYLRDSLQPSNLTSEYSSTPAH